MTNSIFKPLSADEEQAFRQWARDNYIPGELVKEIWHPCCRMECELMNFEEVQKGGQG